jgi:hypothetical protein
MESPVKMDDFSMGERGRWASPQRQKQKVVCWGAELKMNGFVDGNCSIERENQKAHP